MKGLGLARFLYLVALPLGTGKEEKSLHRGKKDSFLTSRRMTGKYWTDNTEDSTRIFFAVLFQRVQTNLGDYSGANLTTVLLVFALVVVFAHFIFMVSNITMPRPLW